MGKHTDFAPQTKVMTRIKNIREDRGLHASDCARIIREATDNDPGYHFTTAMYDAAEKGITKYIPLWAIIALINSEELGLMSADEIFTDVGAAWR